ncbi:MAG: hypothetical protein ACRDSN_09645 [Pseudonocardiaceae bacterium]
MFAIGSICFTGALSHAGYDNSASQMLANVLGRFLLCSHGIGSPQAASPR